MTSCNPVPKTAVIIVNYRSWEPLYKCLDSLMNEMSEPTGDMEVIVIDNNSADGKLDSFRKDFPTVKWIENSTNSGFGVANDLGVMHTQASRLIFLNPDTVLPPGSLSQWIQAFDKLPQPAIAGCPQINLAGRPRKTHDIFPGPFDAIGFVRPLRRKRKKKQHYPAVDWVTGSAVMIHRATLEQLGGWGDMYWMYSEDVDLCRRAKEHRTSVYVTNTKPIIHTHGGSSRIDQHTTAVTKSEVVRSKHIYAQRWFSGPSRLICHFLLMTVSLSKAMLGSLLGILFLHRNPALQAQPLLLRELFKLYTRRLLQNTWSSPRKSPPKSEKQPSTDNW